MGQTLSTHFKFWTHNVEYWGHAYKIDEKKAPKTLEEAPLEPQLVMESSAALHALSSGLLTYCEKENTAYLTCKAENADPEHCIKEALDCRRCTFALADQYIQQCPKEFSFYISCLQTYDNQFKECYEQRRLMEACAANKLGLTFPRAPVSPKFT
eukprot:GEZU01033132.1.p2 GENE.GEZU01033132.1~~GEZU01033132.1.p2  ORF type:complete len:173 (+),score=39.61 GEZU01033132.1:56-520(+)